MTLTINIDEKKLQKVRSIVERKGKSVEELFEKYLDSFLEEESMQPDSFSKLNPSLEIEERPEFRGKSPLEIIREITKNINLSPLQKIRELQDKAGISPIEDFDDREDYREHIIRKNA